jgi:hypothetical protein
VAEWHLILFKESYTDRGGDSYSERFHTITAESRDDLLSQGAAWVAQERFDSNAWDEGEWTILISRGPLTPISAEVLELANPLLEEKQEKAKAAKEELKRRRLLAHEAIERATFERLRAKFEPQPASEEVDRG